MMNAPMKTRSGRDGAALLLAVWALFVLSAAVMIWAGYIKHTLAASTESYNDTEARAMAHSGLALAMHPLVNKETPALQSESGNDPGYSVAVRSEGGKLNVNWILLGEDPRKIDMFKRWLENRGIGFQERERMVDCMLDWTDADNIKRLNGAEDSIGYHPPNRGTFLTVDEIAEVTGTEPLTSQPGWKNGLTVDSAGPIDLSNADYDVLRVLPGVGDAAIDRFLQWRRGPDGIDGTQDDPPIQKLEQVQGFLGLNKTQWAALGGLIMLRDTTWEIISTGWSGKVVRQVTALIKKGGQNPQIITWRE